MRTALDALGTSSLELAIAPPQVEDADGSDESDDEERDEREATPRLTSREELTQTLSTGKVCNPPPPPPLRILRFKKT